MNSHVRQALLVGAVMVALIGCGSTTAPTPSARISPDTSQEAASATASPVETVAPAASPSTAASTTPASGSVRNGHIFYNDAPGDIHSLDPATGKASLLVGGRTNDIGPGISPDGKRFVFFRHDDEAVYVANADGTGVKRLASGKDLGPGDWSPDSRSMAAIPEAGGDLSIFDVDTGKRRTIALPQPVTYLAWLGDTSLVLANANEGNTETLWTINADGTDQTLLTTPHICCGLATVPDRGVLGWTSWDNATGAKGRIHVWKVASGQDLLLPSTDVPGMLFLDPTFSADGKWLTATRFPPNPGKQIALLAADGSGEAMVLGPKVVDNQGVLRAIFSPDSTKLLITDGDGSAWLYDVPSGTGGKMDWPKMFEASWQAQGPAE